MFSPSAMAPQDPQAMLAKILGVQPQGPMSGSPMQPTMQPPVVSGGIGQGQMPGTGPTAGPPRAANNPLGKILGMK